MINFTKLNRIFYFFSSDDFDKNQDDKTLAVVNAIATVLIKQFGVRNQQSGSSMLDRCPSFVSKEKSIKSKLMSKHGKKVRFYNLTTYFMILLPIRFNHLNSIISLDYS